MKIAITLATNKRMTLTIAKPGGDFALFQFPLTDDLELEADLPENSKAIIQSKGEVEVKAEKLTLTGEVLSVDGNLRHSDTRKE